MLFALLASRVVLALSGLWLSGETIHEKPSDWTNALNLYFNMILNLTKTDPSLIGDFDPLFIGEIPLDNGRVYNIEVFGLTTAERTGAVELHLGDTIFSLALDMRVGKITSKAQYVYWPYLLFPIHGEFGVRIDSLGCFTKVEANKSTVRVERFELTDLKDIAITNFTGVSIFLNWLVKAIANSLIDSAVAEARLEIGEKVVESVNALLKDFNVSDFVR